MKSFLYQKLACVAMLMFCITLVDAQTSRKATQDSVTIEQIAIEYSVNTARAKQIYVAINYNGPEIKRAVKNKSLLPDKKRGLLIGLMQERQRYQNTVLTLPEKQIMLQHNKAFKTNRDEVLSLEKHRHETEMEHVPHRVMTKPSVPDSAKVQSQKNNEH